MEKIFQQACILRENFPVVHEFQVKLAKVAYYLKLVFRIIYLHILIALS